MAEGTPMPDFMDQLMKGQIGSGSNSGGGGGGSTAPLPLHILGQIGPIDFVQEETSGILADTANGHLGMQQIGLAAFDTKNKSFIGLDFTDFFSRISGEVTDQTGGTGGDSDGGGGGGSSDSGVSAPSEGGGGDDFQARVHGGDFSADIQGVEISDGGFVGKPSDVPDVRGGGGSSMGMD